MVSDQCSTLDCRRDWGPPHTELELLSGWSHDTLHTAPSGESWIQLGHSINKDPVKLAPSHVLWLLPFEVKVWSVFAIGLGVVH